LGGKYIVSSGVGIGVESVELQPKRSKLLTVSKSTFSFICGKVNDLKLDFYFNKRFNRLYYFYKMKKISISFLVGLVVASCSQKVDIATIDNLNGYWQITKAVKADGEKKEYPVTVDYDYFELKNNVGFHKKVQWQPLGKYLVDAMQEKVVAKQVEDDLVLEFSSPFGKRTEKITSLNKEELVIETNDDSELFYKKVEDNKPRSNAQKVE
jgi:hypothetical protein